MRSYLAVFTSLLLAQAANAADCTDCDDGNALTVAATYTGEQWRQVHGGQATGARYLDNLDITIDADAGRIAGLEGLQLFADLLYNNGHSLNELTGAAQGVSNIEASNALRLYELWTQWNFGSGEQSLRIGLYDLNSEFDSIETAGLFVNPSHGIGPDLAQTGQNGPSIFPVTSLGARLSQAWGAWSAQMAVLDAVPGDLEHPDRTTVRLSEDEGALIVGEANYRSSAVRVGVGYWQYTADFDRHSSDGSDDALAHDKNAGVYAIVERPMFANKSANMNVFVRAGFANGHVNAVDHYLGTGVVYSVNSEAREHQIGLAVAVARFSDPFRRLETDAGHVTGEHESIFELTYRVNVADWLSLQPDVQFIRNPSGSPRLDSAWVVGLRFEVGTQWGWPP